MNAIEAARYCGYSPYTFRRKIREYELPRYGPNRNRFARSVLDAFMESPETFKKVPRARRRNPQKVVV